MNNQDRLLSDEELRDKLKTLTEDGLFDSEYPVIIDLINTQKRLYAESVIGEDVDINEMKVGRIKNIKGDRAGADVNAFDWSIEVETWKNQLRAEQRARIE